MAGKGACAAVWPVGEAYFGWLASPKAPIWAVSRVRLLVDRHFVAFWAWLAQAQGVIAFDVVGQTHQAPLITGCGEAT
jgi:hypothetical protein